MAARIIDQLKKVTISGYKSISSKKPLEIELDQINILLGANGSGKSNIISFFKMLNFMMSGDFQLFIERAGTSQVFLNYGNKHTTTITGELNFENETYINNYTFKLSFATPDRLIITSEEIVWESKKHYQPQSIALTTNFKESALVSNEHQTAVVIRKILANCKVYQFHDSSSNSPIRQSSRIEVADYLQSDGNNLASFLYLLKMSYPANYNRIISYIRQIVPQFKDFYLEPNGKDYVMLKWTDINLNDDIMLPEQFSDGSIRFIALATLLLQPKKTMPNVIIIDEPELGLHPFAITQLAEMVKEASNHTQVIIATQSPGLVDEFEANQITIIEFDDESESTVARKLNTEELSGWLENYSLSELWEKNVLGGRP